MIITDELREYAQSWRETPNLMDNLDAGDVDGILADFERIADRIDAAYQKAEDEWKAKDGQSWLHGYAECRAELMEGNEAITASLEDAGWVKLPVDADGEVIHGGDVMVKPDGYDNRLFTVYGMTLDGGKWLVQGFTPHKLRHHHEPTVEDVLREFGRGWHERMVGPETFDIADYVEQYAAKLCLAKEGA